MKLKIYLFCLIIFQLIGFEGWAGELRLSTEIRAIRTSETQIGIEFCELGKCSPIGPVEGYNLSQWKLLANDCRWVGLYGQPLEMTLDMALMVVPVLAIVRGLSLLAIVSLMLGQSMHVEMLHEPSGSDLIATTQQLGALIIEPNEVKFDMNADDFRRFKDGLSYCADRFEKAQQIQQELYDSNFLPLFWSTPTIL